MFDDTKYIECPQEEATHVWFAGKAHLIAEEKQDVFWCDIRGECIYFYGPGDDGCYTSWYKKCAPESTQKPVFIKEKELEVKFAWSNHYEGVLKAEVAGVATALIVFKKQCIRKPGERNDPDVIKFDDDWTIRQIKEAAAEYARKIAWGEL